MRIDDLGDLGHDVRITHDLRLPPVDMVVLFVDRIADLERRFADIAARLHPAGGFWVAWPKNEARRSTDVTEDVVRRIALAAGMVDNKVCAMGDTWEGLRLVLRVENRDAIAYRAIPRAIPPELSRRTRRPTAPARVAHRSSTSGAGSTLRRARAAGRIGDRRRSARIAHLSPTGHRVRSAVTLCSAIAPRDLVAA